MRGLPVCAIVVRAAAARSLAGSTDRTTTSYSSIELTISLRTLNVSRVRAMTVSAEIKICQEDIF